MPLYNTATSAAAIGVTTKWLDNLLSHYDIPGVQSESQGVSRRLSLAAVTQIALARDLVDMMSLPVPRAISVAADLLDDPSGDRLGAAPVLRITLDLNRFQAGVLTNLASAVELAPSRRRGRPPKR